MQKNQQNQKIRHDKIKNGNLQRMITKRNTGRRDMYKKR